MSLIQWSDEYSVMVREMDDQHKTLVGMINDLHEAMKSGKGKDKMMFCIDNRAGSADYSLAKKNYPVLSELQDR